ncbi:MAG TPA: hemerythrin domain-containing protein [Acidimicrobiales bacterium]|nr:hemerythrin domain-containing protein [Acidimicrobiales bacterium]
MADRTVTDILRDQHLQIVELFDTVQAASGDEKLEAFDCLRALLAVHETAEELIVHPAVRGLGDEADAAVKERLGEEDEAKKVLHQLEKLGADGDGFDDLFASFRKDVTNHAAAEEKQLFPRLDTEVSEESLVRMGEQLEKAEQMAPTHAHPHAPEGRVGNVLTGPLVAMVDKVRDAIHRS